MATIQEAFWAAAQHVDAGRLDDAEQIFRQIVTIDPSQDAAWHMLGVVAIKRGQHGPAVDFIGRAIAIRPKVADYYNNLGSVLAGLGRLSEAEDCFRQALELTPESTPARQNLLRARQEHRPYPMHVPPVKVQPDLDFLLLNLPPRNGGELIPNGLGYVHNALLKSGVRFQTVDLNILWYHQYTQKRVLGQMPVVAPGGYVLKDNLWAPTEHIEWERDEVLEYFRPEIADLLEQVARNRPKAVGLSVHASNRAISKRFVEELRKAAPDTLVVVGGYDCAYADIGRALFPDFDYMAVFEADLTIGPLAVAIAAGQRPGDLPGIISRFDTPGRAFQPAPLLENLDSVDFPRYQWAPLHLYGVPGGMMPITASRGCNWSRCRFCAECFPFRRRAPINVADEIEQWVHRGAENFHFYESDVNGDPQALHDLCSEIVRRGLRVVFSAQIRVDKRNTAEYFQHLHRAGFVHLRFGVDGWTDHVLALQRKGYTMDTVAQNLRDCRAAGIIVGVNMVVGAPGETEADIDETIANLIRCKEHFHSVEFLNPLNLRCVSEYFRNSEQYRIRFRADKDTLRREHPYYVPDELWYSEEPYIDDKVRLARVERIHHALKSCGIAVGAPVEWLLDQLRNPGAFVDGAGEPRRKP